MNPLSTYIHNYSNLSNLYNKFSAESFHVLNQLYKNFIHVGSENMEAYERTWCICEARRLLCMKNLRYHFPTCYAYSVKEPIGELNLKRALDEDT